MVAAPAAAVVAAAVLIGAADKALREDRPESGRFRLLALVAGTFERELAGGKLLGEDVP